MDNNKLTIRPKPPKGDDGYKTFSIRIKTELVEEIEKIVTSSGHTRNELIGVLLDYAVKNCVIDK